MSRGVPRADFEAQIAHMVTDSVSLPAIVQ